ncbi:50S ribosomal protein L19p [Candidatus Nasuia deltocephalinicola]|nr:50S ribosomal protein L19p [Candidatus Nasuia deltocephalinicola]
MFLLKLIEKEEIKKNYLNINFKVGDVISIDYISILNINKIQNFTGIVLYIKNKGINTSFLIKKNFKGINVEKIFKIFSPFIKSIKIKIKNNFKKSKLYFLRKSNTRSLKFKK